MIYFVVILRPRTLTYPCLGGTDMNLTLPNKFDIDARPPGVPVNSVIELSIKHVRARPNTELNTPRAVINIVFGVVPLASGLRIDLFKLSPNFAH